MMPCRHMVAVAVNGLMSVADTNCDLIVENHRYMHNSIYFCNKTHLKTMGTQRKLFKQNYASFYHLDGQ